MTNNNIKNTLDKILKVGLGVAAAGIMTACTTTSQPNDFNSGRSLDDRISGVAVNKTKKQIAEYDVLVESKDAAEKRISLYNTKLEEIKTKFSGHAKATLVGKYSASIKRESEELDVIKSQIDEFNNAKDPFKKTESYLKLVEQGKGLVSSYDSLQKEMAAQLVLIPNEEDKNTVKSSYEAKFKEIEADKKKVALDIIKAEAKFNTPVKPKEEVKPDVKPVEGKTPAPNVNFSYEMVNAEGNKVTVSYGSNKDSKVMLVVDEKEMEFKGGRSGLLNILNDYHGNIGKKDEVDNIVGTYNALNALNNNQSEQFVNGYLTLALQNALQSSEAVKTDENAKVETDSKVEKELKSSEDLNDYKSNLVKNVYVLGINKAIAQYATQEEITVKDAAEMLAHRKGILRSAFECISPFNSIAQLIAPIDSRYEGQDDAIGVMFAAKDLVEGNVNEAYKTKNIAKLSESVNHVSEKILGYLNKGDKKWINILKK